MHWMLELKLLTTVKTFYYEGPSKFEAYKAKIVQPSMDLNSWASWKWLIIQEWNANFMPSVILAQTWSQRVLGHFRNLVMCSTTPLWITFENFPWNYMKKCHEVRSKSCLNWIQWYIWNYNVNMDNKLWSLTLNWT